ncbi:hypothetical protein EG850_00885 [Gulosibacter macacae]|uniref:Uncharacterized protein n=1 Tax=Gulosibacter macacae TaxID=2488791 RepID=A0A3P3W0Z9_9MICO|nr:hypothetical protein [Gulosibacter macacae]RRJ88732.1 hypothetical protein EG850_00885 [Gulosibacter macacae]
MSPLRPRTAVLADAWDAAQLNAPAFTNRDGRVLARAIKCVLDPLVIQPRRRPQLAKPLLNEDALHELQELLTAECERLEAASEWFALLRAERRRRRITVGNAQELYLPRAYELAAQFGHPESNEQAAEAVAEVIDEVHVAAGDDLSDYFGDENAVSAAQTQLDEAWSHLGEQPNAPDLTNLAHTVRAILEPASETALRARWRELLEHGEVAALGQVARRTDGAVAEFLAVAEGAPQAAISRHTPFLPPEVVSEAAAAAPLDRALITRVRAAMRRWRAHSSPPPIAEVVEIEAGRTASAWGLDDESLRAAFLVGVTAAGALNPLAGPAGEQVPQLARELQARARASAHVLHLRRVLHVGAPVHPLQADLVAELNQFAHPYLRRLWVRLHGRDVLDDSLAGEELRDLLTGILRSVLQDEKQRLRAVLERSEGAADAAA